MRYFKKFIKKYWQIIIVIFLAIIFFIGTSSFNYYAQDNNFIKWGSPDETANYIFAKLYGQERKISIEENYNLYVKDIMHPRSFRSDFGALKPVSFLGIILIYGKIVSFLGYKILPYLTPFFAAIGLVYFYLLIKKLFGRHIGLISCCLLSIFPVYIFYTARSMFHNVLFMVFLIIGLYYAVLMGQNKNKRQKGARWSGWYGAIWRNFCTDFKYKWKYWLSAILAGFFIGLAIITRSAELLWLGPLLFILWIFNIKKVCITKLILFLAFLFLAILPVMYHNQILYGSPYFGGYSEMNQSIMNIAGAGSDLIKTTAHGEFSFHKDLIKQINNNIFHFGLHPRKSLEMFYIYFIKMFFWLFWPAVLGLILFFQKWRKIKKKHWAYLASLFVASAILTLYYGSWEFHDNPDPNSHTIGNSYTRYWLPIYLGAMPFMSLFIRKLTWVMAGLLPKRKKQGFFSLVISRRCAAYSLRAVIIIFIAYIPLSFVLWGSDEGLIFITRRQRQSYLEWQRILNLTESNSAVVTFYHDKLLFPERKVIVGSFSDKNMVAEYANLAGRLPLYYYNFTLPPDAIDYLNTRRLGEAGLRITQIERVSGDFTLYKLTKNQSADRGL